MTKKLSVFLLVISLLASPVAFSQDSSRYFVFDVGQSSSNVFRGHSEFDVYRMGVQKEFKRTFWQGDSAKLGGYWEGSLNYWNANRSNEYAVALSPVFVLSFGEGEYRPFI
ncbi:MAG: acyloxyacyl hydrolase, partial [Gammaproteobacteria bacterium]